MDFPLQQTLVRALNSEEDWDSGLNVLYEGLANDFYYARPRDVMLFGDNHDMDRLYTQLGESHEKVEMALAFISTAPRIPQIYYGTEILMGNSEKPGDHGRIRGEFPGGWEDSAANAFTGEGLSPAQARVRQRLKNLLQFRKGSQALKQGETVHFAPQEGVYFLARRHGGETVVLLLNKNPGQLLDTRRFAELGLKGAAKEVLRGKPMEWSDALLLGERGAYVLSFPTNPDPK
jgi:glycosidase